MKTQGFFLTVGRFIWLYLLQLYFSVFEKKTENLAGLKYADLDFF